MDGCVSYRSRTGTLYDCCYWILFVFIYLWCMFSQDAIRETNATNLANSYLKHRFLFVCLLPSVCSDSFPNACPHGNHISFQIFQNRAPKTRSHKAVYCSPTLKASPLPCTGSFPLPCYSWVPVWLLPSSFLTLWSWGSWCNATRMSWSPTAQKPMHRYALAEPSSGQTEKRSCKCTTSWEERCTQPPPTWSTWWEWDTVWVILHSQTNQLFYDLL